MSPSPLPDSGPEPLLTWIQQYQAQVDRNEQNVADLKLELREFTTSTLARIERGDYKCESAVNTVRESLRYWGERLGKVEQQQETARMQFSALELSFKVFAKGVNATIATIAAVLTVFELYMNFGR